MEFSPLPDRQYPDQKMESKFQPVGELDATVLSRAEEINEFLLLKLLSLRKQTRQQILSLDTWYCREDPIFSAKFSVNFSMQDVPLTPAQLECMRGFAQDFASTVRDVTFPQRLASRSAHGQRFLYYLDFYSPYDNPNDPFGSAPMEWHADHLRGQRASLAHISPLNLEVIDGAIHFPFEEYGQAVELFHTKNRENRMWPAKSFRIAFESLIRASTETAVDEGTVSVHSGTSGQVVCIDPFEGVHRRAAVNVQEISMPFLRHRVICFHPRNVVEKAD